MAYLGRGIENLSDRVVLDALTASATASYTLQLNSVNFVPSSASSLTVSLNGVIQKPDSSYTVSGSTLTFSSALTSSDSIDFIIAERGITLQTPSAGSVNTDQLAASAVTNAKIASDAAIATTKLGTGAILQVKQTIMSGDGVSTTAAYPVEVSGLTVSITPSSTSNKILATLDCCVSVAADYWVFAGIRRDSTDLGRQRTSPKSGSSAPQDLIPVSITILDSPSSTSSLTYKAIFGPHTTGTTATFNYREDHSASTTGYSALTVMEIAG